MPKSNLQGYEYSLIGRNCTFSQVFKNIKVNLVLIIKLWLKVVNL